MVLLRLFYFTMGVSGLIREEVFFVGLTIRVTVLIFRRRYVYDVREIFVLDMGGLVWYPPRVFLV